MPFETEAQAPAVEPQAASEDVNWFELEAGPDDSGGTEPEAPAALPVEVATPSAAPQAPPPAPPVASPEQQPPSQPQMQQPQTQVEQPLQPTPEELMAQYEQRLNDAYALSAEDATALLTQPEAVLPALAKRVHLNVMREMQTQMQQMMQAVPAMLQVEAQRVQREESAKTEFFSTWPGLKDHYQAVVTNANMVRRANPQATQEQLVEMTGFMTAVALGLDPGSVKRTGQQPARMPVQRQQPMRPVGSNGSPAGLQPPPQNVFSAFADEDLDYKF